MTKDYYKPGDHNVQCDVCGRKRKRSECKKRWDGMIACTVNSCWDPKPLWQDPIRIRSESKPVRDARPRGQQVDVDFPDTDFDPDDTFPPEIV